MLQFHFIIILVVIERTYSKCDHYYQSSGPSSTKRPFDLCYRSIIDVDLSRTSYRYYCIESTPEQYGNNSVGGYTAFREDFNDIDCQGKPNKTRIVNEPYRILCNNENPICEIFRFRQYPIINASICTYNNSIYVEDIQVTAICKDQSSTSEAIFCTKNPFSGSYFWRNMYYNALCEKDRLFESTYQFEGCQGDSQAYLEILECDAPTNSTVSAKQIPATPTCSNYWQSNNDGPSSSRRPFDVCYRSYRDTTHGDYSYRYICNETVINENYTINGYTVFKQFFNGVGCHGQPNVTLLEDIVPFSIYCGGNDCDIVRYRVYDIDNQIGSCNDITYPSSILAVNDYQENIHVIENCDDDGFISDSFFCRDNYFYINSYNNDKCHFDGIYAAQYYFDGCNYNNQYIQVVDCQVPSAAPTLNPTIDVTSSPSKNPSITTESPTKIPTLNPTSPTKPPIDYSFCTDNKQNGNVRNGLFMRNNNAYSGQQNEYETFCELCVCNDDKTSVVCDGILTSIPNLTDDDKQTFMETCELDDECSFNQVVVKKTEETVKECGCDIFECEPLVNNGNAVVVGLLIYVTIVNVVFVQ